MTIDLTIDLTPEQLARAKNGTEEDWFESLAALITSSNRILGTPDLIAASNTEVIRRISGDLHTITSMIDETLSERYESGRENFNDVEAAELVELAKAHRQYAADRFEQWANGKNPDDANKLEAHPGMYL
jgi:hypothetical protein